MRSAWLRTLSAQLGNPSGLLGGIVVRQLNKGNRGPTAAAVQALGPVEGGNVADIGFGGGIGLRLLLDASPTARVHGVEPSESMIARARRGFRTELASGRLTLHHGAMDRLPFDDGGLDGWISLNTVYFIDDLGSPLAELARVLSPGGTGVIGAADLEWMAAQPFAQQGFTVRPVDDLVAQVEAAGLVRWGDERT
ncbi:hypothetical protein GCM10009815_10830 [Nocardioides marmoribigeumensis]